MYKLYLTLFMCFLLLGCEVRVRDTGTSILGNSRSSNDTLFSIGRGQNNQGIAPLSITESQTTVQAQVLNASPTSNMYEIVTPFGNMTIRLYDETPAHRDNFKKLAESGFYDGTTFHRVIGNFMIQGGDPNSKDNDPNNDGIGGPGYTTNAELNDRFFHKKGAIAAARQPDQVNPQRRSSGSQFYIVQGRAYEEQELSDVERYIGIQIRDNNFRFSPEAREAYKSRGGYPTLDMQYTVFGELVDGFDVLDRISTVPVDGRDRPKDNIPMTIRAIHAQ